VSELTDLMRGVVDVIGTESPYMGVVSAYRESSVLLRESVDSTVGFVFIMSRDKDDLSNRERCYQ
jgi:hypothetical protein